MRSWKDIFLYPVSLIYRLITGIRNFLYNSDILRSTEFHLPVICVGNITVGGTGKTPHTEYLIELLRDKFKVAILSRGYKRKTSGFRIASSACLVSDIGDEPMQMFRKFPDIIVTVDRNRVHGVKSILQADQDTGVIILDDGFQHRRIKPGLSILLSDFDRLIVRDQMLPYGNLRESITNMRRADIILITKSPENITPIQRRLIVKEINKAAYQNLYFTSLIYNAPKAVFDEPDNKVSQLDLSQCAGSGIVLVTGIVNPNPLKEYLMKFFSEIIHLSYPDHYNYKEKDIKSISSAYDDLKSQSKYLFTTEKDAVRLMEFTNIAAPVRSAFFYIPIGIYFLNDNKKDFDNLIVDYVKRDKRNNRISEDKRDN